MNKFKEIKTMLTNKEVVTRYLGTPIKTTSTGIWYKSPFRSERTASFCVSNKGLLILKEKEKKNKKQKN